MWPALSWKGWDTGYWKGITGRDIIISVDGYGVHFVEVKSRVAPVAAEPEESVTRLKQRKITTAALRYLHRDGRSSEREAREVFFDVLAVTFDKGEERVEWFPGAYIPLYV